MKQEHPELTLAKAHRFATLDGAVAAVDEQADSA